MECKDFCEYALKCKGNIENCSGDHTEYVKQLENELSETKLKLIRSFEKYRNECLKILEVKS